MVFTYDSVSKVLLRVNVVSSLGSPKDPVTLEAVFETLPDGVNHISSATLNASSRKVQVRARNVMYQKIANLYCRGLQGGFACAYRKRTFTSGLFSR